MKDRIEVVPTTTSTGLTAWLRPHTIRRVAPNGQTEWSSQVYRSGRPGAVRAAKRAARPEGLSVKVLDGNGKLVRNIYAPDYR